MHRVSFQVERSAEVENDWVRAVVGVTDEDTDSAALAGRINETMAWALGVSKKHGGVEVESGNYHTYPIHDDGRIRRWRASQEIVIEGPDATPVGTLVGKLQARLQLRSMNFSVTPERQREVEGELVAEVLAAFRKRAELVRKSLGASGYQLVSVSIDSGGMSRPRFAQAEMQMMRRAEVGPPALEAGTSRIRVGANGMIELD